MKDKEFRQNLNRALHQPRLQVSEKRLADTVMLAGKMTRRRREGISFTHFLLLQIKFIGWKIWMVQAGFLAVIIGIIGFLYGKNYLDNPQRVVKLLFCLSVFVFMTAVPFIYRSVRYQMQEVEAASRFSSVKLLLAKLIAIGIGDISVLGGIFFITIIKTALQADSAILYLLLPFLILGSGCLFMLGHFTPKRFLAGSMGLCVLLVLACCIVPGHYEYLFQQSFSAGWIVVCLMLAAFCVGQFRYIIYHSTYTEIQLA